MFWSEYGSTIISAFLGLVGTALTAVAGYFGAQIKKRWDALQADKDKKAVVEQVVKAIEQMYSGIKGSDKYAMATENISKMLEQKGIDVTELEIQMLVESCVLEFNKNWKSEETTNEVE